MSIKKLKRAAKAVARERAQPAAPVYSVRGIKIFNGMEGGGYNCTLLRDGKPVADVIDDASGGMLMIDWRDRGEPRIAVKTSRYGGKYKATVQMTPEEKMLHDYASSLPDMVSDDIEDSDGKPMVMEMTSELYIENLVNDALLLKDMAKAMKGKIAFIEDGKLWTIKFVRDEASTKAEVIRRHPGAKVLNGLQPDDLLAAARALRR